MSKQTNKKVKYSIVSNESWTDDKEYNKMSELLEDIDFTESSVEIKALYKDAEDEVGLSFSILHESDYCCGCAEVGNLTAYDSGILRIRAMDLLFSALFESLNNKTVTITTIPEQTHWEAYLAETTLFTAVKTFENKNYTGNMVTLWVSTN